MLNYKLSTKDIDFLYESAFVMIHHFHAKKKPDAVPHQERSLPTM